MQRVETALNPMILTMHNLGDPHLSIMDTLIFANLVDQYTHVFQSLGRCSYSYATSTEPRIAEKPATQPIIWFCGFAGSMRLRESLGTLPLLIHVYDRDYTSCRIRGKIFKRWRCWPSKSTWNCKFDLSPIPDEFGLNKRIQHAIMTL
jgi:hypothetical protein